MVSLVVKGKFGQKPKYIMTMIVSLNFLLLLMSLLRAPIVLKKFIFCLEFTLSFSKHPRSNLTGFNNKFGCQWKDQRSSNKVRQILAHFYKIVAVIVD